MHKLHAYLQRAPQHATRSCGRLRTPAVTQRHEACIIGRIEGVAAGEGHLEEDIVEQCHVVCWRRVACIEVEVDVRRRRRRDGGRGW